MKLLKNTTKNELSILFKGVRYTIKAEGELLVQDDVATFWKKIHGFVQVLEPKKAQETVINPDVPIVLTGLKDVPNSEALDGTSVQTLPVVPTIPEKPTVVRKGSKKE